MKPSIPQGTRDFQAATIRKRYFIINTIREVFELYAFEPLETPAFENLETLTGKYGDEGDQLIFKILNNGLHLESKHEKATAAFENVLKGRSDKNLTERALRYDLTIPFARFVALNHAQLPTPFKRYQMQTVWRADRPQKGRYREFLQCDADIAGSNSLLCDAELAMLYADVFAKLKLPVRIKINNRKILSGLAEITGMAENPSTLTIAIDKLEKIGIEKVKQELQQGGINENQISIIQQYLSLSGPHIEIFNALKQLLKDSDIGLKGVDELETVFNLIDDERFVIDTTLARGLDYYTGTIYEVKADNVKMGSIGGGGRYDDLTGLFGVKGIPGAGISFGIDRIFDVMDELMLFPDDVGGLVTALFFNMGPRESTYSFKLVEQCRKNGIACEMFYEKARLDKQFKYAEKKAIPFVVIIGSEEMNSNQCTIKQLNTGEENKIPVSEIIGFFNKNANFKN